MGLTPSLQSQTLPEAAGSGTRSQARTRSHFALFDSLRAIAALSVLLYHVGAIGGGNRHGELGAYGQELGIGVPIFFLISGFLLYRPFVAARADGRDFPSPARYFRRRALRILPAYWVALTLLAITTGLSGVFSSDWWRFYGLVQIYGTQTFGQGLGVAWTLCVEVSFYVFLPVYAIGWHRWRNADKTRLARAEVLVLAVLAFASLVFRHVVASNSGTLHLASTLPGMFYLFALGMGLAAWSVYAAESSGALINFIRGHADLCWGLAIALFVLRANVQNLVGDDLSVILEGAICFLLLLPAVFGADGPGLSRRMLRSGLLTWVGVISYSIYLYHATLIPPLIKRGIPTVLPGVPWFYLAVGTAAVTIPVAAVSYYLVERPAQGFRWPHRRAMVLRDQHLPVAADPVPSIVMTRDGSL